MTTPITRRSMLAATAAASAAALAGCKSAATSSDPKAKLKPAITLKPGATVLLQGDSITDMGRSRKTQDIPNDFDMLGNGYAKLIAYHLLSRFPEKNLKIFNRGISGHKVPDLAARWDKDTIDLKPDVLSILIGVNDIWHKLAGRYDGTVETYETGYKQLLARTRQELPDVQIIVCEPFVLRTGAVKDNWFPEFDQRRAAAKAAAESVGALYVPFQSMFDNAVAAGSPPNYWAGDGVHPSPAGQGLMAARWVGETGLA